MFAQINKGEATSLPVVIKTDVQGSAEAIENSITKLSTDEVKVNVIYKGVGAITESDVLLASASDAIVVGFNVRPMGNARQIADKEQIDIRTYSIIYSAINDVKDAMEGMLSPDFKEEITGLCEVRETFKISKIGTIAGCMVTKGKIVRNSEIRLIREGVVIYTGVLSSLKRFKDDVKEVAKGYDCGLQIKNYNDGTMSLEDIKNSIRKKDVHFPPSRLVCLENTHNRCFGMPLDMNYINNVSEIVKNNSMMLHVDGARIFNAATALNKSVAELTSEVDSVSFCLSKGLSAPSGSLLCGKKEFMKKLGLIVRL